MGETPSPALSAQEQPSSSLFDAGLDFRVSELIAVGPFIAFTFGRFHRAGLDCERACPPTATGSESVNDLALHVWTFLGAKGMLAP